VFWSNILVVAVVANKTNYLINQYFPSGCISPISNYSYDTNFEHGFLPSLFGFNPGFNDEYWIFLKHGEKCTSTSSYYQGGVGKDYVQVIAEETNYRLTLHYYGEDFQNGKTNLRYNLEYFEDKGFAR
jgi:hypothetical protein